MSISIQKPGVLDRFELERSKGERYILCGLCKGFPHFRYLFGRAYG